MAAKFLFNSQIGLAGTFVKDHWLQDFELSRYNEDPVIGDSLDAASQSSCPPLACQFCPVKGQEHKFVVADELGYVVLYDTRQSLSHSPFESFAAHDNAVFDISWMNSDPRLVTASGDQTLALIDMNSCEIIETFKSHTGSVKSVDVLKNSNAVFASGSRDGHIMIWDSRCNKKGDTVPPVNTIRNAHCTPVQSAVKGRKRSKLGPALDNQQSVTIVLFQSDVNLVSSGAVDGVVKLWDLRKNYCICGNEPLAKVTFPYAGSSERKCGYSSMTLDSFSTRLYVNCTDDVIYEYDLATCLPTPVSSYCGHRNKTFYVKSSISPDDRYILSGSSDSAAYIYRVGHPNKAAVVLKEHRNEVTGVAWSPYDFGKLVTLCDDNMVRMWKLIHRAQDYGATEIYGKAELYKANSDITPLKLSTPSVPSPKSLMSPSNKLKRKLTPSSNKKPTVVKSPSIQQWFNREFPKRKIPDDWPSSPSKKSPATSLLSPRKLLISPMKTPDAGGFRAVPFGITETTPRGNNAKVVTPRMANCKRKLIDGNEEGSMSPSKKRVAGDLPLDPSGVVGSYDRRDEKTNEAVTPKSNRSRILNDASVNQSPTANLPNLVFDGPRQKIHIQRTESGKENSHLDWLSRFRLEKHGFLPFSNYSPTRRKTAGSDSVGDSLTETSSIESSPAKLRSASPVPGVPSVLKFFRQK